MKSPKSVGVKVEKQTRRSKLPQADVLQHFVDWKGKNINGTWSEYHKSAKERFGRNKVSTSRVHKNRLYNINQRLVSSGFEALTIPTSGVSFKKVASGLGLKKMSKKKK